MFKRHWLIWLVAFAVLVSVSTVYGISRVKTWTDGEILNSTDLNAEFDNQLNKINALDAVDATLVPKTTTVNGHALSGNVTVTTTDLSLNNVLNVAQEPALGNPASDGFILSSTAAGVRSWTTPYTMISAPVRNTMQAGANTIGTGSGLQPSLAGASTAVRLTFAAGFNTGGALDYAGEITSNESWPAVSASRTNYLYADRNTGTGAITLGSTVVPPIYGPHDISTDSPADACNGGTAIENGHSGGYVVANIFDNNSGGSTWWQSAQTGAGVNGVSWCGYHFLTPITPESFTFKQYAADAYYYVTSVKFQYSDDGSSWSDQGTYGLAGGANTVPLTGAVTAHAYWRWLANTGTTGQVWQVDEAEIIPKVSTGQYWYDTVNHVSKSWNGSSWDTVQRVMIGEAVTNGAAVTSVVQYALNGRYDSYDQTTTAASTTLNHNIGTDAVKVTLWEGVPGSGSRTQIMSKDFTLARNSVTWTAVAGTSRMVVERAF